ncbi:HNH endonuclease [Mycobacterium phage Adnama]|uniref:Endonuclease VII n=1 Tax=Mycobacterium phage IHOP TaxID=2250301 RepID=A0A345KXD0_9CAUD|nr:endonuclease VII [Mycobacterium phage Murphy]AXC35867.1 HNH endonuclease [Mycobacterium phage Adnama]AXH47682.1 endonuclease VII [Mycobacterium phage IHOP]AXQ63629.1 HNH endonuclease [Mycobacterium phage Easy2Say]AYD83735.1 HNH endonuclease [Mycobacterium phage Gemini]QZD96718.1 endonuclease VII [Mycobacterium phage Wiggin]
MAGRKKCSVAGCINRVKAYGICATHHDRKKAGWPDWDTRPIASKRRLNYGRFTDYEPWEYSLLKHYGIEKGGYERLLEAQGGRCGICSRVACPHGSPLCGGPLSSNGPHPGSPMRRLQPGAREVWGRPRHPNVRGQVLIRTVKSGPQRPRICLPRATSQRPGFELVLQEG